MVQGRKGNDPDRMKLIEEAIKSTSEECFVWPYAKHNQGYGVGQIDGKTIGVHEYVCQRIHGPKPTRWHNAAHSCGNGHLACISGNHLSWKTPKENAADRVPHGTHFRGEKSPKAKITNEQAREIRRLSGKMRQDDIAVKFGISQTQVSAIVIRKEWKYI